MYVFTGSTPGRDGDFDAEVILHEYTHGLSNRLVGGGVGISALQPRGMGEGWSDFYSASLLSDPGDDVNGNYASGAYVSYQLGGLTQNYYFGIRRYPYSTDITKNPLTFKDIDPAQASLHPGIPRSPIAGPTANEVHNMGEVWCVTLWEARAKLINKFGSAAGNQLMLQLTTDGMKLSPANPNFLQARDAIIQADLVDTGGANRAELWAAFAKRGMGFSAFCPPSSTTSGIVESFDLPDDLSVAPAAPFLVTTSIGGPFPTQTYTLTNTGNAPLSWTATNTQPWLNLNVKAGTLAPGTSIFVTASFTPAAGLLPLGAYSDTITFTNLTSGRSLTRVTTLSLQPPVVLSFSLDSDPGWTRTGEWAFGHPTGGGGAVHGFHDPNNGATGTNVFGINLNGDYSLAVAPASYLTAGPYDFTGYANSRVQFQRWLNSDFIPYVTETLEVSRNGTTWTKVWDNGSTEITSSAWTKVQHDISAVADNQPTVYLRWGHQVTNGGAFAYSGWNIDDVELLGQTGAAAPIITTQPLSQTATVGSTVVFSVSATGLPAPTYQWNFNGASILGATSPTLTLSKVQLKNVGSYTVTVSNSLGSVTSSAATLSGTSPTPIILTPPANLTVTAGQTATFSVEATGTEALTYQWRRNGFPIVGATGASLVLSNVSRTDADYYDVVLAAGLSALTSPVVRLLVAPTAYVTTVAPDPAWDLQLESPGGNGISVTPLNDGRAYITGMFTSVNGLRRMNVARVNTDGATIDPSFTPPEFDNAVRSVVVQNDSKILVAGDFLRVNGVSRPRLVRLNSDGSIDEGFVTAFTTTASVLTIAVQNDGRVLVGGTFFGYGGTGRNFLIRLNADGSLDSTFLTLGVVGTVNKIVVQNDGRILLGGSFTGYLDLAGVRTDRPRLARLNPDGTLDQTFNAGQGPALVVNALAVQADGKIVAGGSFTSVAGIPVGSIARFSSTGSLDTDFLAGGGTGFNSNVTTLAIQADGQILAGGNFTSYGGVTINRLARLNSDGTRDSTFQTLGFNTTVTGVALQNNGQLLVAGGFSGYLNPANLQITRVNFARLNSSGTLDSGFNFSFRSAGVVNGLVSLPGGKLLVTGSFNSVRGKTSPFGLVRINSDGTVDSTFSGAGSGPGGTVSAAALQPDGKILIAGFFSTYAGTPANGIARINTDGTLDSTFNPGVGLFGGNTLAILPGGRVFVGGGFTGAGGVPRGRVAVFGPTGALDATFAAGAGANFTVYTSLVQPDGKIVIGGSFTTYDGTPTGRIARLNPDGTLDPTFLLGAGASFDVSALALQSDEKILIGGPFSTFNGVNRSGVARLNADGTLDPTFVPPFLAPAYSLVAQEDGRVIVRGAFTTSSGGAGSAYLARLNSDGSRDATFAAGGLTASSARPSVLVLRDNGQLAMQSNGLTAFVMTRTASAPAIVAQPSDLAVTAGDTATFSVTGTSRGLPSTYQWFFNGTPLTGATNPSLVLSNVRVAQAGTYQVMVKNELGTVTSSAATLTVAKAAAPVTLSDLAQTYDGTPRPVSVTTEPLGLSIAVTYDGSATIPTNAGSYSIAAIVTDPNYEGSAVGTLTIAKAAAEVGLNGLNTVYDGSAKAVTVTTAPANLSVDVTYNGSVTAPSNAGTYDVVATINDQNHVGTTSGTLVIHKAVATVILGESSVTYDGSPKPVSVTTLPVGLSVSVSYDGSSTAPSAAGSYAVVATVNEANYTGSAVATLVIAPASATIGLSGLHALYDGTPKAAIATTTPSGLSVSLTYDGKTAAPIYPGSYAVVATIDDSNYTGSATGVLSIAITALVRHAPSVDGGLDGSLQVLLPESAILNSSAWVSGDFLVTGTPLVQLNGHPIFGGRREATGSAVPSNYQVILNSGATLRYLVRRVDAIAMPVVDTPPQPSGTRNVFINTIDDEVGAFSTLRDLTLNGNVGPYAIPAGTYGTLTSNGSGGFILGEAGATTPAVYNLQCLTLSGSSQLVLLGPVIINLASGPSLSVSVGLADHPEWLTINLASGGLTLNGSVSFNGYVIAPTGSVTLNSGAALNGGVISDRLSINSNALLSTPTP